MQNTSRKEGPSEAIKTKDSVLSVGLSTGPGRES